VSLLDERRAKVSILACHDQLDMQRGVSYDQP